MARNNRCFVTWLNSRNHQDIVARVFKLKLKSLLHDLFYSPKPVLGKMVALIYVIEWQKWGPPHAHILGICDNANKPKTIDDYDSIVCAEIPDKDTFPELYAIVTKFMMHGPCGVSNPNSPCMEDGKCTKKFPKDFTEWTQNKSVMVIPSTGEEMMANVLWRMVYPLTTDI